MVFGVADYAASVRARTTNIGGANPAYGVLADPTPATGERTFHLGDQWHFGISRHGRRVPRGGGAPDRRTLRRLHGSRRIRSAAAPRRGLGCDGKWAIHPSQIPLANDVFTPSAEEVERARRIVQAMEDAAKQGRGAVSLDGRLIDAASIRMAENLLSQVERSGVAGVSR